jgi:hypothetical protein
LTEHLIAVAQNLPLGTTPAEISELLWTRIGLYIDPAVISVRESEYSTSAFVRITEEAVVDFLNRNFESLVLDGQRHAVQFQKKMWKEKAFNRKGIRQLA